MIVKSKLIEKKRDVRKYEISHRRDRRYSWKPNIIHIVKYGGLGWVMENSPFRSSFFLLPREVILRVEAIMRGLNSNG